ncbi:MULTISPECIES: N-acetylmuramoyl-L-alanine amidase [Methylomicrobium]|uniref:N-acetylmuramoyl-L-alanine amidase AmiC n=1 Tax=Methylomicrobium album BG8 TaxID=686340 RepID=H8GKG1_METAL|nr:MULTISPECIES: N-acetylmuramoyl-L-alanine amidase [Methylomicrobium]EIC30452.1 N-acetylmuramoyl-L-alanine amidase [Methylomicrobium album BG8]
MRHFAKSFFLLALQLFSSVAFAAQVSVNSLHFWSSAKQSRMMIDVSAIPSHSISLTEHPGRLVIDIQNARLKGELSQPPASHPFFSRIRTDQKQKTLRIVADLKRQIDYESFTLNPNKMYGHRLVVDLTDKGPLSDSPNASEKFSAQAAKPKAKAQAPQKLAKRAAGNDNPAKSAKGAATSAGPIGRNIVVAIDAGHGGEDPGAHGPAGTEEKRVVLAIAKKLAALINRQRGMRAVLVRKGDYYVDLRKRMEIARAANADLFVSVHADAYQKSDVKGASVFTLSNRGASSEAARWLADSENAADLVGGVRLDDKEEVLASVLLDLSQTATLEASNNVAGQVLKSFQNIGELHFSSVQKAGFLVLKSPDIPSILVETAFISNPGEERKLNNTEHQSKIALAIFNGIRNYFKQYTPNDTRVAEL